MTIVVWPESELPRPLRDGQVKSLGDNRRFAEPAQGIPRLRSDQSLIAGTAELRFNFTAAERARFERFWREDISRGEPFVMPSFDNHCHPMLDENGEELLDENGAVLLISDYWLCVIAPGGPSYQRATSTRWTVTFQVMILPS